jgi:hypothetical protein
VDKKARRARKKTRLFIRISNMIRILWLLGRRIPRCCGVIGPFDAEIDSGVYSFTGIGVGYRWKVVVYRKWSERFAARKVVGPSEIRRSE